MNSANVKSLLLMRGNTGAPVANLKQALLNVLGKDAAAVYPGLAGGEDFDAGTEAALRAWQASVGLVADGIAGPCTQSALGMVKHAAPKVALDAATVKGFFPGTRYSSIAANLPYVAAALAAFGLTNADMLSVALGTIRAEAAAFMPIAELPSHFNTLPGQPAFSVYEPTFSKKPLGNDAPGDGARFRGRGYVQLTGRDNYVKYGKRLDIPLAENPDSACSPEIAACLLAAYLDANQKELRAALAQGDLKTVRQVVNGGSHGLEPFCDTFTRAQTTWGVAKPDPAKAVPVGAAPDSAPRHAQRIARLGGFARPFLYPAAAFAAEGVPAGREDYPIHRGLHPSRAYTQPGEGRRLHRLRLGWRGQPPALARQRDAGKAGIGQPAHVVPLRQTVRRIRGRKLRRLKLPGRAQGLVPQRGLPGVAVVLHAGQRYPAAGGLGQGRDGTDAGGLLPHRNPVHYRFAGGDTGSRGNLRLGLYPCGLGIDAA